jgi:hypothetical protein
MYQSKQIIDMLVKESIGTLVIGKNDGWKQNIKIRNQSRRSLERLKVWSYPGYSYLITGRAPLHSVWGLVKRTDLPSGSHQGQLRD